MSILVCVCVLIETLVFKESRFSCYMKYTLRSTTFSSRPGEKKKKELTCGTRKHMGVADCTRKVHMKVINFVFKVTIVNAFL